MKNSYDSEDDVRPSSEVPLIPQDSPAADYTRRKRVEPIIPWILPVILSVVLLVLFGLTRDPSVPPTDLSCIQRLEAYSPALGAAIPLHRVKFNGTLDYPSPFRGSPSPAVDDAWETLVNGKTRELFPRPITVLSGGSPPGVVGAVGIPDNDFMKLDQHLDENTVRLGAHYDGRIMASLEVFHQLHCLNLIRQYIDKDYYQNRSVSFKDPPAMLRTHVGHCIEMLRQKLTCDVDMGIITYNWVAIRDEPWPNFNTVHKFRSFDGAVEWTRERLVRGEQVRKPKGVKGLDTPP